ncbi:hypothetical protein KAR91_51945 [Candidatus Pacearchaeota archaeon]|nr:hypothetical protein [Candidatus Pacearchaeota archaeon]
MAFLTEYGMNQAQLPSLMGRMHFVAPGAGGYNMNGETFGASDGNDGFSPERALATIDQAIANATASAGEAIVCLPGTHTPGASLAMSKAGVKLLSLDAVRGGNPLRQSTTIAAVTGDQTINVTAADCEIAGFNIIPVTADTAIDFSAAADGLHIHHNHFDLATPAASTGTKGVEALGAADGVYLHDNGYFADGAQGEAINMTATTNSLVEDELIMLSTGTWAAAMVTGAATDTLTINRLRCLTTAGTIVIGVNGTAATIAGGVQCLNGRFSDGVTVALDGFGAGEAEIAENYQMGVGGTDGGVLIVAIT